MTKNIIAIHGAFSTPTIFNFLKKELSEFDWTLIDYSSTQTDVNKLIDGIKSQFINSTKQYHIVSHSMGGLIALSLASHPWVKSITTIATPLDGVDALSSYFGRISFLSEITRYGKFINDIQKSNYMIPIQHIITTEGFNPFTYEKSDGVVTLRSQRGWRAGKTHDVAANHAEVMLHEKTVELLRNFLLTCWINN
jgi:esterase/lipase